MRLGNGFSVLVKDERDNQLRKPKRWVIVHCRPFSESTDLRYAYCYPLGSMGRRTFMSLKAQEELSSVWEMQTLAARCNGSTK
jgi:hypothetical protein